MIEVKTADLIGPALDWAVAKATGAHELKIGADKGISCIYQLPDGGCWTQYYRPSTGWDQGGPLIEKYKVDLYFDGRAWWTQAGTVDTGPLACRHEAVLIAACRAVVAAHLGYTVQIPDELAERVRR